LESSNKSCWRHRWWRWFSRSTMLSCHQSSEIMFHGWRTRQLCWSNFCLFNDELHSWPACIVVWHLLNTLVFVSSHCIPWSLFKNRIEECYSEMSYFSVFWILNALHAFNHSLPI
jgi:hypothetical protein